MSDSLEKKIDFIITSITNIDNRLNNLDARVTNLDSRLTNIESRLTSIDDNIRKIAQWLPLENTDLIPAPVRNKKLAKQNV